MLLQELYVLFVAQDLDSFINCGSECQERTGSNLGYLIMCLYM